MNTTISALRPHVARLVIGAILFALPAILADAYYLDLVFQIYLWWAVASAWNILGGYGGQFSLGHAGFFAIGAYAMVILNVRVGLSPWLGLLAGVVISGAVALGLGALTLRLRGPFFALLTLAFGEIVRVVAVLWRPVTNGSDGLSLPPNGTIADLFFGDARGYCYVALLLAGATYLVTAVIERRRLGYMFLALRENEEAARALGVLALRLRLGSLVLSAALTAIAGGVLAAYLRYIDPDSVAGIDISIKIALIAIVGGVATAAGPLIGSIVIIVVTTVLRDSLAQTLGSGYLVIYGVILIVIVLAAPAGLGPTVANAFRRFRRWSTDATS